jgi:transposase
MKQPTLSSPSTAHGGNNLVRIGGMLKICNVMRITDDLKVKFRQAHLLGDGFKDKEVPYIQVPRPATESAPDSATIERYYFCRRYMVQASVYLPMLLKTKHLADDAVAAETPHLLTAEEGMLEMSLTAGNINSSKWPYALRTALFEKCVHKYYKTHSSLEVARMLFTTEATVKRCLNSMAEVLSSPTEESTSRNRLQDAPEYQAIQEEVKAARIKAYNSKPRIIGSFTAADVLPTMYDIQGNSGRHNGILIVPRVCPVLRIPLDYNVFENRNALNKARVWRKTPGSDGTAPMDKDNVTIMSKAATRVLEGTQAASVLDGLSGEARDALAEWQGKYGTRTVPREVKIGRPRKA